MVPPDGSPIDWSGLLRWYLGADPLMADLDECCTVARSFPTGTATANLGAAEMLNGLTRHAEFWLLKHPCPEGWNGRYLWNIVETFLSIGELVVSLDGAIPEAVSDPLAQMVDNACALVDDVHQVNDRLAVEHAVDTTDGLTEDPQPG